MNLYLVTVEIYKSRFARVEVSSQNEITIITHAKKKYPMLGFI